MAATARPARQGAGRRLAGLLGRLDTDLTMSSVLQRIDGAARRRPVVISFLNQHGANMAARDPEFADALQRADLLLRDGIGAKMGCWAIGVPAGANLNGTDLIPALLERRKGARVMLCGTAEPWLGLAADRLARQGQLIVATMTGFDAEPAYLAAIERIRPDIVVLAMGMPKQERLADRLHDRLSFGCVIVNGGAVLDFLAERHPRAPTALRALGLEWLFRLAREPRRLFRRYVIGIPVFLTHVAAARRYRLSSADGERGMAS